VVFANFGMIPVLPATPAMVAIRADARAVRVSTCSMARRALRRPG
jgi:hypothetical protein